jgi:hypothetical protein
MADGRGDGLRRAFREHLIRRAAFALESFDRLVRRSDALSAVPAVAPIRADACELLAVVAHWRTAPGLDEAFTACLRGLLELPVRRLEVVVLTNDAAGTHRSLEGLFGAQGGVEIHRSTWRSPSSARITITVERWVPVRPFRTGFHLTWRHKHVLRRAVRADAFTHFLYLEDDMGFSAANLEMWLAARTILAPHGLLPGFVRFERTGQDRVLVDQTRSGQHGATDVHGVLDAFGPVVARIPTRPYQACYLADRPLLEQHLRESPLRSPLRSNVVRWDLRERAAAGTVFAPTPQPFRAFLRPTRAPARPPVRHAVLVSGDPAHRGALVEGGLIEHLRPTYSRDPSSRHGSIPVEEF